jgi:heat shock protein beta
MADRLNKEYTKLNDYLKTHLKDEVEDVTVSTRLEDSPCALVAKAWGMTGTMQKLMRAQV